MAGRKYHCISNAGSRESTLRVNALYFLTLFTLIFWSLAKFIYTFMFTYTHISHNTYMSNFIILSEKNKAEIPS